MLKVRKTQVCMSALGLAFAILNANAPEKAIAAVKTNATSKTNATENANAPTSVEADDSVRSVLMRLESAMASKNVEDAAALFTNDVHTIDQSGEEIRGLKALKERFERRQNGSAAAAAVGIHPQTITFPAPTVAFVVGEVSRKNGQEELPASRFSMLMVKKDNNWLINELQETTMQSAQTESHLHELDWLIGQWAANTSTSAAQLDFEWSPDKKFIKSNCTLIRSGKPPQVDSQVIGWDPQHNTIISWHFDSNGGFGSGTWSKQPDQNTWTTVVAGVGTDGSNSLASNVFTVKSSDEFIWQSVHRTLNGEPVGDTEPITVRRVKR